MLTKRGNTYEISIDDDELIIFRLGTTYSPVIFIRFLSTLIVLRLRGDTAMNNVSRPSPWKVDHIRAEGEVRRHEHLESIRALLFEFAQFLQEVPINRAVCFFFERLLLVVTIAPFVETINNLRGTINMVRCKNSRGTYRRSCQSYQGRWHWIQNVTHVWAKPDEDGSLNDKAQRNVCERNVRTL